MRRTFRIVSGLANSHWFLWALTQNNSFCRIKFFIIPTSQYVSNCVWYCFMSHLMNKENEFCHKPTSHQNKKPNISFTISSTFHFFGASYRCRLLHFKFSVVYENVCIGKNAVKSYSVNKKNTT